MKTFVLQLEIISESFYLFLNTCKVLLRKGPRWSETLQAIYQIGVGSMPIISIATAFAGLVVTSEIAWHMQQVLHTVSMIPGFTAQFIVRELGIAIPALLIVSKVGASITAEVGTMKITEQLEALELLGINSTHYLVVPRFLACIFSSICLTIISISITLCCAVAIAYSNYNISLMEYLNAVGKFLSVKDLFLAITKACVFGALIPILSCTYGFRCSGGAQGVGSATTQSVVASTIVVIIWDFILTYFFTQIG